MWFLQTYLSDTKFQQKYSSFRLAQRVFGRIKSHLFNHIKIYDPPQKIIENIPPALIGIGAILGSIACPQIAQKTQQMIIIEGKRPNFFKDFAYELYLKTKGKLNPSTSGPELSASAPASMRASIDLCQHDLVNNSNSLIAGGPSLDDLSNGTAFTFFPHESLNVQNGNFVNAQMAFFSTLIDISDRLRSVPKSGRQSALVSELSLLNNNFPAHIFIPLRVPKDPQSLLSYKVLRISLPDAVVLNSADRVSNHFFRKLNSI
jgi:hypothetical protein